MWWDAGRDRVRGKGRRVNETGMWKEWVMNMGDKREEYEGKKRIKERRKG